MPPPRAHELARPSCRRRSSTRRSSDAALAGRSGHVEVSLRTRRRNPDGAELAVDVAARGWPATAGVTLLALVVGYVLLRRLRAAPVALMTRAITERVAASRSFVFETTGASFASWLKRAKARGSHLEPSGRAAEPGPDPLPPAVVVDLSARLDLPRVVIGGRGARTLVVDAAAELR